MAQTIDSSAIPLALHDRRRPWHRTALKPSWGLFVALVLVVVVAAPVAAVFAFVVRPTEGLWMHLVHTFLC